MAQTTYCYHCGVHHPIEEMRQLMTKAGKKWRCIASIEAAKKSSTQRDAFGKTVTTTKKTANQARIRARVSVERLTGA